MLFVSGEKPERFPKALAAGADLVCIDLEDAVHPHRKAEARAAVFAFAAQHTHAPGQPMLAVRLNNLRTHEGLKDVLALIDSGVMLDFLVLPKVEFAEDITLIHAWAPQAFKALAVLIETPLGIENAPAMARTVREGGGKLAALMLGGADLSVELGCNFGWDGLLHARGALVNAARTSGLQVWDVPHLDLNDLDGLLEETRAVLRLGMTCKSAIHPQQVATIHKAFAPAASDLVWARALVEANTAREASGQTAGAFLHRGRMVDPPVLAKALRIIEIADRSQAPST